MSYDIISVTSSLLRHRKRHQTNITRFSIMGLYQSKFLVATPFLITLGEIYPHKRLKQLHEGAFLSS